MNKFALFLLSVFLCNVAHGNDDIQHQILDAQIKKLEQEKSEKHAKLKECEENTKKLKIAGSVTIAATTVGVAGNVALAKKKNELGGKSVTSGGGNNFVDTRPQNEKDCDSIQTLCAVGALSGDDCNGC